MARIGNNQRSANRVAVDVGATGTKPPSKGAVVILLVSLVSVVWALAMMTTPGRIAYYYFFIYAEFYMGVLVLVSLSITIMVGLVSTDRLVLSIRQRVMLQSVHRTTGVMAVSSLVVHLWTKTVEHHIRLLDIVIPFLNPGNTVYVGLGTLSAWILVFVGWSGIARTKFIGRGKPWMWRALHSISYLMWPVALMHGLGAGRPAKTWVIVSYVVCVLLVLIGLAVRLSVSLNRNKDFSSPAGLNVKPVGSLVPTASPAMKKPRRRERAPEPEVLGPVAVVDTFQPVRPVSPAQQISAFEEPVAPPRQRRGGAEQPEQQLRVPIDDQIEYEEPRPRRHTGADTSGRLRRADLEDTSARLRRGDLEDTAARLRRGDLEDTAARLRRAEMDDTRLHRPAFNEVIPPRPRRRTVEPKSLYDDAVDEPRGHRTVDDFDEIPRQRRRTNQKPSGPISRFEPRLGDAEDAPRGRRAAGVDPVSAGGSTFLPRADGPEWDEGPTLVDMASRRGRRSDQPRRADQPEPIRSPAGRRSRGRDNSDDVVDDEYWSKLRGEAR